MESKSSDDPALDSMNRVKEDIEQENADDIVDYENGLLVLGKDFRNSVVARPQNDDNRRRDHNVEEDGQTRILLRLVNLLLT